MAEPQLANAATEPSIFEQVAALPKPLIVRMDKSRDFSTVHGERASDDAHAEVFFYQDGLPFNAHGTLLWTRAEVQADKKKLLKAEKLLRRALKMLKDAPGDDADDDDEDDDRDEIDEIEDDGPAPVNLTEWASGKEFQWQEVSNAIARRYHVRVQNKRAAVELLVKEGVISEAALSKSYRKLLESD